MVALHRGAVGEVFGHYWGGGLEPAGAMSPRWRFSAARPERCFGMPRHAGALWGPLGRVLHVLSVAGSVPIRCVLVGARAGQGGKEH